MLVFDTVNQKDEFNGVIKHMIHLLGIISLDFVKILKYLVIAKAIANLGLYKY